MPGARPGKPFVPLPPTLAKIIAVVSAPPMALAELAIPRLGMFRFDGVQVDMAAQDTVCDHTIAEAAFDMRMRGFEPELTVYADGIG